MKITTPENLLANQKLTIDKALFISVASLIILIGGFTALNYVKGRFPEDISNSYEEMPSRSWMFKELTGFKEEVLAKISEFEDLDQMKKEFKSLIDGQISDLTKEKILKEISGTFKNELMSKTKLDIIDQEFLEMKRRIYIETSRITRYAYTNLFIGFITTFGVIGFLISSLLGMDTTGFTTNDYLMHFIPRVSLSILIEVFSFFFLRLYSKNLDDIKYWNNERTNLEMKIVGVKTAMLMNDDKTTALIIKNIVTTERNFILKKGESTVELEKNKTSDSSNASLLEAIVKILNKK